MSSLVVVSLPHASLTRTGPAPAAPANRMAASKGIIAGCSGSDHRLAPAQPTRSAMESGFSTSSRKQLALGSRPQVGGLQMAVFLLDACSLLRRPYISRRPLGVGGNTSSSMGAIRGGGTLISQSPVRGWCAPPLRAPSMLFAHRVPRFVRTHEDISGGFRAKSRNPQKILVGRNRVHWQFKPDRWKDRPMQQDWRA